MSHLYFASNVSALDMWLRSVAARRCPRNGQNHEVCNCHLDDTNTYPCVNCKGQHSAAYRECPRMKLQVHINNLVATEHINKKEA